MALKITGRYSVAERRHGASTAKHATFKCSACNKLCFATFPFGATSEQRHAVMKAALDEHRRVCTVGQAEDSRSFEISYGRR